MHNNKLDKYIFKGNERLKGLPVESFVFTVNSIKELRIDIFDSIFNHVDIIQQKKIFSKKYEYLITIYLEDVKYDDKEYAEFLGKIFILCSKLYLEIKTIGLNF